MIIKKFEKVPTPPEGTDIITILHEENGMYIYKSLIPYDYKFSSIVYFLSGLNGDEYGQYETFEKAMERLKELPIDEKTRHEFYDQ